MRIPDGVSRQEAKRVLTARLAEEGLLSAHYVGDPPDAAAIAFSGDQHVDRVPGMSASMCRTRGPSAGPDARLRTGVLMCHSLTLAQAKVLSLRAVGRLKPPVHLNEGCRESLTLVEAARHLVVGDHL
jgi:hypothetical protein